MVILYGNVKPIHGNGDDLLEIVVVIFHGVYWKNHGCVADDLMAI